MLIKFLLAFSLLVSLSFATNYPKTYAKLSTPLFNAAQYFIEYEDVNNLTFLIKEYQSEVDRAILDGYMADSTKDKKKKKIYLLKLRKLEASYNKLLHSLHTTITQSIKDDDYKLFLKLTSYAFDGLFMNTNLRNEAITFYSKHKHDTNLKCLVLEKNIADEKLYTQTQELFAAEIIHSSYNSQSNIKSTKSVYISSTRVENTIKVFIHNEHIYDVTIRMKPSFENIIMSIKPALEFVIKSKSKHHYTTLIIGSGKSQYGFSWSYSMGSKDAVHTKNYIYQLPFKKGTSHVVSQGYNAKETHNGSSAYSIDFPMPIGTKVYAARNGVVVKTKSNSDRGGYDKKYASSGNYVKVMHSDGTFAIYYHLKYNGVLVKTGDKVFKGESIAYSGNTGYSSGPHLHFSVFKAKSAGKRETIPTIFKTLKGLVNKPIKGTYYKAI